MTLHGWTDDGLIGDGYTLEVVGLGIWEYEPWHPYDTVIEAENKFVQDDITEPVQRINKRDNIFSSSGYEIFYPLLQRQYR